MPSELSNFAGRLRQFMADRDRFPVSALEDISGGDSKGTPTFGRAADGDRPRSEMAFAALARELFSLQFAANPVYRRVCEARGIAPETLGGWRDIPAMPTAAFREFEVTCLPAEQRNRVFHSSGTTEQRPSRHFHSTESLAVYEASVWKWFVRHVWPDFKSEVSNLRLAFLTPPLEQAPHSSLVYMFETVRCHCGAPDSAFLGVAGAGGEWSLDFDRTLAALLEAVASRGPLVWLGTAFSFVHLLDFMARQNLRFALPPGSCVMETGGYKGRSRSLPKSELHALIADRLGIPCSRIVCEYGMSELSSQAYDHAASDKWQVTRPREGESCRPSRLTRHFHFPSWARALVISPETGREVAEGETGLIRVFDLANVWSVMAIQTEDVGVRRGDGFELIGRARQADPRGCSLMLP